MNKSRQQSKHYTVIVLAEGGKTVRKLTVSSRSIRAIVYTASVLLLLLVGAGVTVALLAGGWNDATIREASLVVREGELKEKLQASTGEMHTLEAKVTSLSTSLDRMSDYARKLRRFTHLSDPSRHLAMGPVSPTTEDDDAPPRPDETDPESQAMRVALLRKRADRLTAEASEQETRLKSLERHFQERAGVLSATPSVWPTRGIVSSPFGMRRDPMIGRYAIHKGLDVHADSGAPIIAPADGLVTVAGPKGAYGNCVILDHGFGVTTRYGHLSRVDVRVGQRVQRGHRVGAVGSTGRSTGPHLHYEVRVHGLPQDPTSYILD